MPDVKPVPRWLRAANRAALVMSRIGLTMGPVHVLTVPGRRTGKPRSAPVSPLTGQRRPVPSPSFLDKLILTH